MSQLESQIRATIVGELAEKIGKKQPAIRQIIHHSSTRRLEGALKDSDIDLSLVLDSHPLIFTSLFREVLDSQVEGVIEKYGLKLGNKAMQVHLTLITDRMIADPDGTIATQQGKEALAEILTKGKVVYNREY